MSEIIRKYLESEDTPASVLVAVAVDILGGDFFTFEIETVVDSLNATFSISVPDDNIDKLQAMQTIYTTNSAFMSLPVFLAVTDALNSNGVDFEYADIPDVTEVAWAITEIMMHMPEEEDEDFLHPDIVLFIKLLLTREGFTRIPSSLWFIKDLSIPAVADTLLDDPMLFEAYDQLKVQAATEVDAYVTSKVAAIISAIDEMPLRDKNPTSWGKFKGQAVSG